jgi:hypothetical protein
MTGSLSLRIGLVLIQEVVVVMALIVAGLVTRNIRMALKSHDRVELSSREERRMRKARVDTDMNGLAVDRNGIN